VRHLDEDERVWVQYEEPEAPAWAEAHLAECQACRDRQTELREALGLAALALDEGFEPPADYEQRVWRRLEPRLVRARRSRWLPARLPAWAALAAALLLAFLVGRYAAPPAPSAAPLSAPVRERILLVAVGAHLERSRLVLMELSNADPNTPVDISAERRSAQALLSANRLYRRAAQRSGEPLVAGVLDELERVLIDVAHRPDEPGPGELLELQERIAARGLILKVRVLDDSLRAREKAPAPPGRQRVS
jgi:anti-sigma factor RsiW